MSGTTNSKQERVAQELARLAVLDRAGCLDLWKTWFGCEAPRYLSAVFMRKALAHEAQCRLLGGQAASDVRALRAVANGRRSAVRAAPALSAGTHLVREWNGRTYQVEVTKSGYEMDGKSYRSLTAIARRITGASWSGPRFFGLVDRSDRQQNGEKHQSASDQGNDQTGDQLRSPTPVDSVPPEFDLTDSVDSGFSGSPRAELTGPRPADVEVPPR
jgi:hypothetical protein